MKKIGLTVLAIILGFSVFSAHSAEVKIDPRLITFARSAAADQTAKVIVVMNEPESLMPVPSRYDYQGVVNFLRARADSSWKTVLKGLQTAGVSKKDFRILDLFYINNSFSAVVTPQGLHSLSAIAGLKKIYLNGPMDNERPLARSRADQPGQSISAPYDFSQIGLDRVIAENPKLNGSRVVVGSIDTGVDGTHPAVASKIKLFHDGDKVCDKPFDRATHGTHTTGTIVGGDRGENVIGIAPGAKIIVSAGLNGYDVMLRSMQFMMDPDGKPATRDFPRAINNSWNCNNAPDLEVFYTALAAWEAAGILPVFSAGNAGPGDESITKPHEHPAVLAVGATGTNGKIATFSSRGPGNFKGQKTQKPDLTAPGVDIVSSVPGGIYEKNSGTSMASPHVTGSAALLFQVNSKLTPAQVKSLLVSTAQPTREDGTPGAAGVWNKAYGFGKLDIYRAIHTLKKAEDINYFHGLALHAQSLDALMFEHSDLMESELLSTENGEMIPADFRYPDGADGLTWASPSQIWN